MESHQLAGDTTEHVPDDWVIVHVMFWALVNPQTAFGCHEARAIRLI